MPQRSRRSEPPTPDPHATALGRAIKVLRTEQDIDRAELAESSGLSYPYLSEIENGKKRPSSRALEAIAEALEMRPHELLAAADWRTQTTERSPRMMSRADASRSWRRSESPEVQAFAAMDAVPDRAEDVRASLRALIDSLTIEDKNLVLALVRRLLDKGPVDKGPDAPN